MKFIRKKIRAFFCITIACVFIFSNAWAIDRFVFASCLFRELFHNLSSENSVTTLRQELKVITTSPEVGRFLTYVTEVVGPNRILFRDTPSDLSTKFITDTDYLPVFSGSDPLGNNLHGGVIRVRGYWIVPNSILIKNIKDISKFNSIKLADGIGKYVKLEFKIGHPERGSDGVFRDQEGVVDKPGIVLLQSDLNLLLAGFNSYKQNIDEVTFRTLGLTFSANGKTNLLNKAGDIHALFSSIERLHKLLPIGTLSKPELNIRYNRTARKVMFTHPKPFEIQITVDQDVYIRNLQNGKEFIYAPEERIVELKIPVEYALKSDSELESMGLSDLVKIRSAYLTGIKKSPGTERGTGKRSRGIQEMGDLILKHSIAETENEIAVDFN